MLTLTQRKWSVSRSRWHHRRQGSIFPENENSRDTFISGLGTGPSVNHENSHSINNIWLIYSPVSSCFLPHEEVSKQLILQRANILFLLVLKKKQKKKNLEGSSVWRLNITSENITIYLSECLWNCDTSISHLTNDSWWSGLQLCHVYATECSFNNTLLFRCPEIFFPYIYIRAVSLSYIRAIQYICSSAAALPPGLSSDSTQTSLQLRCCPEPDIC